MTKGIKADQGPTALRGVGEFNAGLAHDMGGLHFGPYAQELIASCE